MKRLLFDRRDGKRIKHKDPIMRLIPYIMPHRYDSEVYIEDTIDLEKTDTIIKLMRKDGHRIIFLHIVLAAIVRTMNDLPKVNRFVAGRKVYARKEIALSFAIKKSLDFDSEETIIKIKFDPKDTLGDVVKKVNTAIEHNRQTENKNQTDKVARLFNLLPSCLLRFAVFIVRRLDNHRLLPKFLINASPFHSSAFVTDLGSLGINPAYHHLYDFGTTSLFAAFGTKKKQIKLNSDNEVQNNKTMDLRIVVDERIVDGFYYAQCIKRVKRYIQNPSLLLDPPEHSNIDDEIR